MSNELYVSLTIPMEYVRGGAEDVCLDMPVSYALGLAKIIQDGAVHAVAQEVVHNLPDCEAMACALLEEKMKA